MFASRLALAATCAALLLSGCSGTAPTPTAVATASADEAATAGPSGGSTQAAVSSPSDGPTKLPKSGALAAGSYYVDGPDEVAGARLIFDVPSGWAAADLIAKHEGAPSEVELDTWVVTHILEDACQWGKLVSAGTTPDEFITVLAAQQSRTASRPSVTALDGHPAAQITMTVSPDLDATTCTNGVLRYWPGPGPDLGSGTCCHRPGNIDVVYAVEVAGQRTIVIARHYSGASAQDLAELQRVVDSIHIEP